MSRLLLAAATLEAGNGGIARVSRMTARALLDRKMPLSIVAYLDSRANIDGSNNDFAGGNKILFFLRHHSKALRSRSTIYDHIGLTKARSRLPGLRQPFAVWVHGTEIWKDMSKTDRNTLDVARLVLANSDYTKRRCERLHGAIPNMRVCWLATEQDEPASWSGPAAEGPPCALILSRIDSSENYKGHAELIAAWPDVVARVPDARLVCVGGGTGLAALRARAAASPVAANIEIPGFVPEDEMPGVWRRARVLAMPSRNEGFGLVYIEAMRFGLPVIASNEDAAQEVNVHGETGFNVPQADRRALTDALVTLLSDRSRATMMGAAGQARWRAHFRFSQFERRLIPLLAEAGILP